LQLYRLEESSEYEDDSTQRQPVSEIVAKVEENASHARHKSIVPSLDLSSVQMGSPKPVAKVDLFKSSQ